MKHIFFAYPAGMPGAALLCLRASVVLLLFAILAELNPSSWATWVVDLAAVAVIMGLATRILAGGCAVVCFVLLWPAGDGTHLVLLSCALAAAALSMIGPGAFSIDSWLYGRSTIHLPD